ncbi:MAG: M18 family aminopeptidase [Treponema sp.]
MGQDNASALIRFIDKSPSVYHVIENAEDILRNAGFKKLSGGDLFNLEPEKKYFTVHKSGTALIAWQMSSRIRARAFRIIGSHSDSPTLRIKPNPEISVQNHFLKLNTEVYGGPILSTWFDRPLSLAGRVVLKNHDPFAPNNKTIDFDKNLLVIPNLAIHMNREVNDGYKIDKQKDLLPLMGIVSGRFEKQDFLLNLIAAKLSVPYTAILDFDLFLYDREPGCFCGLANEFFSVGKIDNLGMAYASLDSLIQESEAGDFIKVACVFDHEEVGSASPQGAGSPFLADTLQRISFAAPQNGTVHPFERFQQQLNQSFFISADQAHGLHPNYPEKNDITNFPLINGGPVIKVAASMSYASDGVSSGIFKSICKKADVPYQIFVNRSDMRGGSTIGPITAGNLNIRTVDIGNPILAMHSIRELGGVADQTYITQVFRQYYRP